MVVVAALGALYTTGATVVAGTTLDRLQGCSPQFVEERKSLLGDAHATGMSIVDEDLGLTCVGMKRRAQTTDIPPIAHGKQGQQADGGVLHGVEPT
jgi:hypothetical protein